MDYGAKKGIDFQGPVTEAKVALARKLAVILHRMLADGSVFDVTKAAAA